MPTTEQDALDRADMERLAAGHDAALNELMARHAAPVFRFLVRMVGNEEDAGDLAQETFVRVYGARESFRPAHRFVTWLYTIAANLARNHIRWRRRHPEVSLDTPPDDGEVPLAARLAAAGDSPVEECEKQELVAAVRAAVGKLPEDLREAIVLCEWEAMSMAEAAEVLSTTPKAIDSRLYRARKRLKEDLRQWIER